MLYCYTTLSCGRGIARGCAASSNIRHQRLTNQKCQIELTGYSRTIHVRASALRYADIDEERTACQSNTAMQQQNSSITLRRI
jgi:hypothetical protein